MFDPRRHAVAVLAALALVIPSSALAQQPTLLAQHDDATATLAQAPPPLSEDPFAGEGDEEEEERDDEPAREEPAATEPESLPQTGLESGLVALLGLALIASGSGLRLTLRRDAG